MPELVCAADDPRWHEERRRGVTATDITAILGLSPYESAYSLYCRKTGDVEDTHFDNDRLRLGRFLESYIVQRWCDLRHIPEAHRAGAHASLYRSTDRPWQLATPDRVFHDEPLEVKSWADIDRDAWLTGPPPRVRAQALWQMDTLDVARGHVGVLFLPSGEFRSYVIEHTDYEKTCSHYGAGATSILGTCPACTDIDLMRTAARDFLDRIDLRDPPPIDGSSATLAALRARFTPHPGKEAEIDPGLWTSWEAFKAMVDQSTAVLKATEAEIRVQLGEASILTIDGTRVATRVTGKSEVKAHTRTNDYIRRVSKKGSTDD